MVLVIALGGGDVIDGKSIENRGGNHNSIQGKVMLGAAWLRKRVNKERHRNTEYINAEMSVSHLIAAELWATHWS